MNFKIWIPTFGMICRPRCLDPRVRPYIRLVCSIWVILLWLVLHLAFIVQIGIYTRYDVQFCDFDKYIWCGLPSSWSYQDMLMLLRGDDDGINDKEKYIDRSARMCYSLFKLWKEPISIESCSLRYCPTYDPFERMDQVTLYMSAIDGSWTQPQSVWQQRAPSPWTESITLETIGNTLVCKCGLADSIICDVRIVLPFVGCIFLMTQCLYILNRIYLMIIRLKNDHGSVTAVWINDMVPYCTSFSMTILGFGMYLCALFVSTFIYGTLNQTPYLAWTVLLTCMPHTIYVISCCLHVALRCITLCFGCVMRSSCIQDFVAHVSMCCKVACSCMCNCPIHAQTMCAKISTCCTWSRLMLYQTCYNIVCMCRVLNNLQDPSQAAHHVHVEPHHLRVESQHHHDVDSKYGEPS
jgi:hypothetical protein